MITVKVLNAFGRVTSSSDLRLFGGTLGMIHSIEGFIRNKEVSGIHVVVNTSVDFQHPTAVWDALYDALSPQGIRNIRLSIRGPRHTVTVGATHFSPLSN